MSQKLTIEILREKFKETQERGEFLFIYNRAGFECLVRDIGYVKVYIKTNENLNQEFDIDYFLSEYKIKQPKNEYEVLHEHLDVIKGYLELKKFTQKNETYQFTGRKLLRNKRTGEIVEYNEGLLK